MLTYVYGMDLNMIFNMHMLMLKQPRSPPALAALPSIPPSWAPAPARMRELWPPARSHPVLWRPEQLGAQATDRSPVQ